MEIRSIKGISREKWIDFKSLAARKNVAMGELFEIMLNDYYKRSNLLWGEILNGKKILSEEEAEELIREVKSIRKERGFRI